MTKRILIVEDNEDMQLLYRRLFREETGFEIEQTDTGEMALEKIPFLKPDLMIIDISLPGMTGLELTKIVRERHPGIKILIVTGHEVSRYYDEAIRSAADDLISKDVGLEIAAECRKLLNGAAD